MNGLSRRSMAALIAGLVVSLAGLVLMLASPFAGSVVSENLWLVEPLAVAGAAGIAAGLATAVAVLTLGQRSRAAAESTKMRQQWSQLTQHYFDVFGHDMGRPIRRILGKEREVRARLAEAQKKVEPAIQELLDEIEQQAPSFRLMVSNIQVLVQLEDQAARAQVAPVAPSQIVRNVVDRYVGIGRDRGVNISWWSEPAEFGLEYSDAAALDHIVTNLVDNAIRFATSQVEVRLTRNPSHFFVRVWDDGRGIPEHYLAHIFDRGWTPEVAGRQERTSSGLGLYIARTLALRSRGELTVESVATAGPGHHTAFTLTLPRANPGDGIGNR
ncbi:MAG: HAMP domain-containing histidine kinase [SAR202 cluster bacterium]|nr:HAMP domain-containing histidine kinase [SAR202 cluster bacterium]